MRLERTGRIILVVQALLVGGLAVAGLFAAAAAPGGVAMLAGFELNVAHSTLLLVTAGASALAAGWRRVARAWALTQAVCYTVAFLIGTAVSAGQVRDTWLSLNAADHFLHLGLALLGGLLASVMLVQPVFLPEAAEEAAEGREPVPREQESDETREMIAAEVAVAEGHPTAGQARRVEQDAARRAAAERRRAWEKYQG